MTQHEISCHWNEGMSFTAEVNGHTIIMDSPPEKGPNPKPLMLVALAGCTAMDVLPMMQKMRVDFKDFRVKVKAELTDEHPRVYSKVIIVYEIIGGNPDPAKVEKCIHLSHEKYCGVSAMMRQAMKIESEVVYSRE